MRIEYSNGHVKYVDDEAEARNILDAQYPDAVYGDWEPINETRERMLVWEDGDAAGTLGDGDDGSYALAEIVRVPV